MKFKLSTDPEVRGKVLKEFIDHSEGCEVNFSVLNFGRLSESVIAKGIKVCVASDHNVKVAEKGEVRKNVI